MDFMRLLFIADGRSPTALSWLRYWVDRGHFVHLVSTYPCDPLGGLVSFNVFPVAFSSFAGTQVSNTHAAPRRPGLAGRLRGGLRRLRYYLGPLSLSAYRSRYANLITALKPDLVHALRIPFEGMLASSTPPAIPLVISTWGNDLTLHAHGSLWMASLTRRVLTRAAGLITDTRRDLNLANEFGFTVGKPVLVVPGSGGIRLDEIMAVPRTEQLPEDLPGEPIIVNPRGQRPGSVRQDIFFQAIPGVLEKFPQAIFVCPSLAGDAQAEHWVQKLGIRANTKLWPRLSQAQLWSLFYRSQIFVSPSLHDGTPNSLLETMACGCFPVVGNIESMREWVQNGVNGYLVEATDPSSVTNAILLAIQKPALRTAAAQLNAALIAERAAYAPNMGRVEIFYRSLLPGG